MLIKLNFVLGQRTINNRYYDPSKFIEQLNKLLKQKTKIPIGPDSKSIDDKSGLVPEDMVVGYATKFHINESNEVFFEVEEMSSATETYLEQNPGVIELSTFAFGTLGENDVVDDFTLTSLFMTMDKINEEVK